jgi:O-antigen/teichoic acid export membrane protein
VPIFIGGALLADPIMTLAFGAAFAGGGSLLMLLMPNVVLGSLAALYAGRLVPHGRERSYLACVAAGAAVNLALNLAFIPEYGAKAAAFAALASQASVAASAAYFGSDLPRLAVGRALVIPLLASLVMAAALAGLAATRINVVLLILFGAAVYAASYWVLAGLGRRYRI